MTATHGWVAVRGRMAALAWGLTLALGQAAAATLAAEVVLSEIHYHPVEEPEFDADGNPKLDLANDVHEFVELQNVGTNVVDLAGWKLSGGISLTLPAGTVIAPGEFRVVARDPARLAAVYGLTAATVLGPYEGYLGNSSDTVKLVDARGTTMDTVAYRSRFPWPTGADALGDQDRFTGLAAKDHQYAGRSLQRVSASWSGSDPANWLASPLTGPTPGAAQAVTRAIPQPVVLAQSAGPVGGDGNIVRPNTDVTVSCAFSGTNELSEVTLEWFVDDMNSYAETHTRVAMTALGNGRFLATIPGQASRSIVRYRFLANRGDGVDLVSPRPDDAPIAPVGANGAREAWFGFFVTPVRTSTNAAVYDVFVSTTSLSRMASNISQSPNRVTTASATGVPRDEPYVASTAPQWNGTVPGVFAVDGELWDIQIRYHGSKYHRAASNLSYKLHFPSSHPLNGQASWFETLHGAEFVEAQKLNRLVGLPTSRMRFVDWYFNGNANNVHTEQGEYADEMLDEYHAIQHRLNPDTDNEENGELYKDVGNRDASQNSVEGPYTRGDEAPLAANAGWTQLQRYEWTFSLQNHGWKGSKPIRDLIEGMWVARGDTPATHNFSSDATKLASARAWFTNHWDIETTLTSMALLEWMSIWDDAAQNHFFWRRANGQWSRLGWDYDNVMSTSSGGGGGPGGGGPGGGGGGGGPGGGSSQTIYGGEYGATTVFDGVNWWKDTFYKCFRAEYQQRLWELNNSVLDPTNLTALGFTRAVTFAKARQTYVNTQLASLGSYTKPARPVNASPANGSAVSVATDLATTAYSHPGGVAHAATLWELRSQSGDYENPVLHVTSTEDLTRYPLPIKKLDLGQTYFWRATHLDANGHPSVVAAETSFTWGVASSGGQSVVLNEVLAFNRNTVANGGEFSDYVELRNTGTSEVSLNGYTLSDDPLQPTKFAFPSDATIPAGGYRVVWCDKETEAPGWHTGFGLNSDGDAVFLYQGSTLVDSLAFGPQAPDVSLGRVVDGTGNWQANVPTPGTANAAQVLGSAQALRVNEWMADPAYGDDWFELYNPGTAVVALAGLYLSDSSADLQTTSIPPLSFIAAGGFTRFLADGKASGGNSANFKLSSAGDSIFLTDTDGVTVLDSVNFAAQAIDVSQGRLPDGAGTVIAFTGQTASPGYRNWTLAPVVVHEVLANASAPLEDAIELRNLSAAAVDLGGWWLSDDLLAARKFRIPAGTVVPAGGYAVFYERDFAAATVPFALNARGDEVVLSEVDATGALTGRASLVRFGASPENLSFGRVPATGLGPSSGGAEFVLLSTPTFGQDLPSSVEVFRTGQGGANADPYLSPVVFTEVNYHPPDATDGDDTAGEFLELRNESEAAEDLSGWRVRGDAEFNFPVGTTLAAGGYALVVSFDPADATAMQAFRARYGVAATVPVFGPLSEPLANSTFDVELAYPLAIQGQRAYVNLDKVEYRDRAPWDDRADGGGYALQRISTETIGNSAGNWTAALPSPGTASVSATEAPLLTVLGAGGGVLNLRVSQAAAGSFLVESSTNLITWTTRLTTNATTVPFEWSDTTATAPASFYRARREP